MKKTFLALSLLLSLSSAHAYYLIDCGPEFRAETLDDVFSGKNGARWNLAIRESWLPEGSARARMFVNGEKKHLSVFVTEGIGAEEMGHRYDIDDLKSSTPELSIYSVGGFVGEAHVATVSCVSFTE